MFWRWNVDEEENDEEDDDEEDGSGDGTNFEDDEDSEELGSGKYQYCCNNGKQPGLNGWECKGIVLEVTGSNPGPGKINLKKIEKTINGIPDSN